MKTTKHFSDEIEFVMDGKSYIWEGIFTLTTHTDKGDRDYPGMSSTEVTIDRTEFIGVFDEDLDDHRLIEMDSDLESVVINEINYRLL